MKPLRNGWALVPLRLVIGFGFAAHGVAKLTRGPEQFAAILATMGIPLPEIAAWGTALLELVGGVALMLGVCVVPFAVPLMIIMLTAMLGVHWRYGFSSIRLLSLTPMGADFGPVGYEINLLYLSALIALATSGSTPLSIARWVETRKRPEAAVPA